MRVLHSFSTISRDLPTVCCVGTFDGVHLGHQQLISAAVVEARAKTMQSAVITFFPHPRVVLGRAPSRYLTQQDQKIALLQQLGIDVVLIHAFTRETMQTSADQFVNQICTAFELRSLWLGPDFTLGHNRQGTADYLANIGKTADFTVNVMPHAQLAERPISSSRIREALDQGNLDEANACLGRPYQVNATHLQDDRWCAGDQAWLPASGTYAVNIRNRPNRATISTDRCTLTLAEPLVPRIPSNITIQFV